MNIARKLQELLDKNHLSRSKLAREIGVHTSTITNWLDGKDAKLEKLSALCDYFGCTIDYLAGEEQKTPADPEISGREFEKHQKERMRS